MIKRIFLIAWVGFIFSLALFQGFTSLLYEDVNIIIDTVKYIPLELRVVFFACWIALLWAFYNAIVS